MKNISSRKFVLCQYHGREIPHTGEGCCDFYNTGNHKCEYSKYKISKRSLRNKIAKLSERDSILKDFSQPSEEE
jgi:hypothetical protein